LARDLDDREAPERVRVATVGTEHADEKGGETLTRRP
jgi:hypothetical protein